MKRVQRVRELMHEMGVRDERVSVVGYGEEFAEHDNSTDDDRLIIDELTSQFSN